MVYIFEGIQLFEGENKNRILILIRIAPKPLLYSLLYTCCFGRVGGAGRLLRLQLVSRLPLLILLLLLLLLVMCCW